MGHQTQIDDAYKILACLGAFLPDSYVNFVIAKWMRSFRYGNDYMKLIHSDSYFKAYRGYIVSILLDEKTKVRLAVLVDDPDVALGFSVVSGSVLHYVYVGPDFRHAGIGRMLVPTKITEFTHLTKTGLKLWPKHAPEARFNPFQ